MLSTYRSVTVALLFLLAAATLPVGAHAQTSDAPPIPASFFPTMLQLRYSPSLSNADMDRTWGNDSFGVPYMHRKTEDSLGRTSGWTEAGLWQKGKSYAYFGVYVSTYGTSTAGTAGNVAAFADWQSCEAGLWRIPLAQSQPKTIVPATLQGQGETRVVTRKQGGPMITISAWWGGTQEVESVAVFSPDVMELTAGKRILAALVRYAIRLPGSVST